MQQTLQATRNTVHYIRGAEPPSWVRPAVRSDVRDIVETVRLARPNCRPLTAAEVEASLLTFSVVSTPTRNVAAVGALRPVYSCEAELGSIAVAPNQKGKGLGAQLVRFLIIDAHGRAVRTVRCTTRVPSFFERFGFEVVGAAGTPDWAATNGDGKMPPRLQMALALEPALCS